MVPSACRKQRKFQPDFLFACQSKAPRYVRLVTAEEIKAGLAAITGADNPTTKHLLLAGLCTKLFAERGIDVFVVSDSAPASGGIELYAVSDTRVAPRDRQEIMGQLGAVGGSHSWQVAGTRMALVIGCTRDPQSLIRHVETPLGKVAVVREDELLV